MIELLPSQRRFLSGALAPGIRTAENGYAVVREYVDEAKSGLVDDRPEFKKMIDEARLPEARFKEVLIRQTQ